jgi:hypothetical protein
MIARARALQFLAAFALPASVNAQQPRSQTVFSPAQNGTVSIRIAVVLADYTVKPLPLVPVVARRSDRADSVAGRTDLDGRLTLTLPVGQYTVRAYTPLPIAGRSYMWAVPVAVRASMTEVIQLTNANASVDSTIVATVPAQPATTNRQIAEPATPPAAPVVEPTSVAPSAAGSGVVRSTPARANTSGFILGLSLNGSSIRFDDASSSIESGGGLSAQIGWGFTRNFALLLDVSGAAIRSDDGDYGLGHAEISGRWHFASPTRALVPFLEVGFAERAVVQNDVVYYDDFGNSLAGDFSLLGSGVSFGGGLQYHVSPTMALGGSLKWTVGSFSTVKLDNVSVDGLDISATTARVNLGFIWYPVMGGIR